MPENIYGKSRPITMPIVDGFTDYQYNEAEQWFIVIS